MDDTKVFKTGKGLNVAHLNVRSLLAGGKSDLLKLQIADSGVEIFTMSETWLTQAIPDELVRVPNYSVSRVDRSWGGHHNGPAKRGGGVLTFIKSGIPFSEEKYSNLNNSSPDLEMQWIQISLQNVRPIVVVNAYRPPQGDYKECCKMLTEAFSKADLKENTDIFLLGDFNIDLDD